MEYLHSKCTEVLASLQFDVINFNSCKCNFQTIHNTMCEETVFWDLNYSIKYRALGTEDIRTKVLKVSSIIFESHFKKVLKRTLFEEYGRSGGEVV